MRERLYNPAQLTREELKGTFVVRIRELNELIRVVKRQPKDGAIQHILIIGARGMGKTSLGLRLLAAVSDDLELRTLWQPVAFFEESYGVSDLASLWLNALQHLSEAVGDIKWSHRADALRNSESNAERLAALALGALIDYRQESGKKLILFVENLDEIFKQFSDRNDVSRLRAVLHENQDIMLIGTANAIFEEVSGRGEPLYEFFRLTRLKGLDEDETLDFISSFAARETYKGLSDVLVQARGRIEVIRRLTGGNPRLILLAARLMAQTPNGAARDDLEKLVDEQTPYFKARIESLSAQARLVFHALAAGWLPMLSREVAEKTRLTSSHASAQIKHLVRHGYLEEIHWPGERRVRYQLSERFYNIYYLLRFTRSEKDRLERLIEFLVQLFGRSAASQLAVSTMKRLQEVATNEDEWLALDILAARLKTDFEPKAAREFVSGALRLCNEHGRDLPEVIRQGFETVLRDTDAAKQYVAAAVRHLSQHPNDAVTWVRLGLTSATTGDFVKAVEAMNRARELWPEALLTWTLLGFVHILQGSSAEAEEALRTAVNVADAHPLSLFGLGMFLQSQERLEEAEQSYRLAITKDPTLQPAWDSLAETLLAREKYQDVVELLTAIHGSLANDPPLLIHLGQAYRKLKNSERAADVLKRALELDPSNRQARTYLCYTYQEAGDTGEAIRLAQNWVAAEPDDSHGCALLGFLQFTEERFDEAEHAFEQAVKLGDNGVLTHVMLAAIAGPRRKNWPVSLHHLGIAIDRKKDDNSWILKSPVVSMLIEATANGYGAEVLRFLDNANLKHLLEPLWHAVREESGELLPPLPAETMGAVAEVKRQIDEIRLRAIPAASSGQHIKEEQSATTR